MKKQVKIRQIKSSTPKLASAVEYLMEQLSPGARRREVGKRVKSLLRNPAVILLGAFDTHNALIGIVTLYQVETLGRKFLLFEECVVDARFRGEGIGQELAGAAVNLIRDNPDLGDRIEGTCHENNAAAWNAYMKGGFHDRHNRAFFWVRHWT